MKIKFPKPIYAFIDSQNLNLGVRELGWKLDFRKFRIFLADKYKVEKAFLFIGFIEEYAGLYLYLSDYCGYELIYKPTLEINRAGERSIKGNVDAELVLHTMIEKDHFSKAVIVTGDGDFHCLLDYLEKKGKLEQLIVPNQQKYSRLLQEFRHRITFVNYLKKKVKDKKFGRRHLSI
jgi:uncharacterized LabA/DUF88 family protein